MAGKKRTKATAGKKEFEKMPAGKTSFKKALWTRNERSVG